MGFKVPSLLKKLRKIVQFRPFIVGALLGGVPLSRQIQQARRAKVDLLEVRLDTFPHPEQGEKVIRDVKRRIRVPLILTFRSHSEGGQKKPFGNTDRTRLIKALLPAVQLIDVEIRQTRFARDLTRAARHRGVGVIHSIHDFSGPGDWSSIKRLAYASRRMKGDIFKAAVTPRSEEGALEFLYKGYHLPNPMKVLIGMGKAGVASRYIGFSFGSILTYGHLGKSAAPGQVAVSDLAKSVRNIYPS